MGDDNKHNEGLAATLESLMKAISAIQQLLPGLHENKTALMNLEKQGVATEAKVAKLYQMLFEGDGQPSLLVEIAGLQSGVKSLTGLVEKLSEDKTTMKTVQTQSKSAIVVAVIAGACTIVGTTIMALVAVYGHH